MKRPVESDYTSHVAYTRALEEYCDALEQPKQEPVAWAGVDFSIDCTPPQRKPLTEEEINRIDGATPFHEDTAWLIRFARAIERAHGIGGSDEN